MDTLIQTFTAALTLQNGYLLSTTLLPLAPPTNPAYLYTLRQSASPATIGPNVKRALSYNPGLALSKKEATAWSDLYVAYYTAVCELVNADEVLNQVRRLNPGGGDRGGEVARQWVRVYEAWKEVSSALYRGYSSAGFAAWTVPCLYVVGRYLRVFAIRADDEARNAVLAGADMRGGGLEEEETGEGENERLEDAARVMNRLFSLCVSDRAPIEASRKWALYNTANLLFKTYFRLTSISLCKNILRTIAAQAAAPNADLPPLAAVPKSHQTTFQYYRGVTAFLDEDYKTADESLSHALALLPRTDRGYDTQTEAGARACQKNRDLVLTYLIPIRLITRGKLPSGTLLASSPRLARLFAPLCRAIKAGDLRGFDAALAGGEAEFVKRRIYLTLERARDACLRNLLRKVVLAAGWEEGKEGQVRKTRIKVDEFVAGVRVVTEGRGGAGASVMGVDGVDGVQEERDEVEWMIANCIYKGLMKGYIARDHGIVVLSKAGAFPDTGV